MIPKVLPISGKTISKRSPTNALGAIPLYETKWWACPLSTTIISRLGDVINCCAQHDGSDTSFRQSAHSLRSAGTVAGTARRALDPPRQSGGLPQAFRIFFRSPVQMSRSSSEGRARTLRHRGTSNDRKRGPAERENSSRKKTKQIRKSDPKGDKRHPKGTPTGTKTHKKTQKNALRKKPRIMIDFGSYFGRPDP